MSREAASTPELAVVIPTHQRRDSLEQVLGGLDRQAYPLSSLEVAVVCDGCTDGTQEMLRTRRTGYQLRIVEQPGRGAAAARNAGLAATTAPLVLFLDDDVIPFPELIAEHVRTHGVETNLAVLGPMLAPDRGISPWVAAEAWALRKQYEAMAANLWVPTARQFYTGNASVRREHLLRVGAFDESFRRAEDVQLAHRLIRAGVVFRFQPAAHATHVASRPFRGWLRNAYEYGRADVVMARTLDLSIIELAAREFHYRHPLTRRAVTWTLGHPRVAPAMAPIGFLAAHAARALGLARGAHGVCGLMFNSAYWAGVSSELGGPDKARELMQAQRHHAELFSAHVRADAMVVARRLREP